MSRNAIANIRNMSKDSVSDVLRISNKLGITYEDVRISRRKKFIEYFTLYR